MPVEEKKEESIGNSNKVSEDKQTNRTFTQSELDQFVAKGQAKVEEKYKDYASLVETVEALTQEKKAREESEMSEIQKLQKAQEELTSVNSQLQTELQQKNIDILKSNVLSDPKYSALPRAYKKSVVGQDEETIQKAADAVLEEFNADLKRIVAGSSGNVGAPPEGKKEEFKPAPTPATSIRDAFKARYG